MVATSVMRHAVADGERDAAKSVSDLIVLFSRIGGSLKLVVESQDGSPRETLVGQGLAQAFLQLSDLIQSGREVSMFSDDPEISPEMASDLLGISRPMVVQRIKCGDLNARMVGAHHRIKMSDILAFRAKEAEREAAMAEFSELTDEMASRHGF